MDTFGSVSRADDGNDRFASGATADGTATPAKDGSDPGATDAGMASPVNRGSEPLEPGEPPHLAGPLIIYSVLRVALIAVLTAVLAIFMPLIVALMFAIVVQLPLAWIVFAGPRRKVNEAMAQRSATRRAERERLQSALAGDEPLQ